jgi:predicted RNA-binding protein YlxR (DUF448 family)
MSAFPERRPLASDGGPATGAPGQVAADLPPKGGRRRAPERRCLVTREVLPKSRLVRFVAAPDGEIVADVAARLPGRGLWLSARSDIVGRAVARNVFARALKHPVRVAEDLPARVEAQLGERCLSLLGLARRAGQAVAGWERVRGLVEAGRAGVVVFAADGAQGAHDKLRRLAHEVPVIGLFPGHAIGRIFDRDHVVHAAVARGRLAQELIEEAGRLAGFRPSRDLKLD